MGTAEAGKGGEVIQVARIVRHKNYNPTLIDFDYSLLELSREIHFDDTKQPIKLPEADEHDNDGVMVRVSGWGNTQNSSENDEWLRETRVPLVNSDLCHEKYKEFGGITPRMICAGYMDGGKDACQGDSGGPLFTEQGSFSHHILILVSNLWFSFRVLGRSGFMGIRMCQARLSRCLFKGFCW